MGKDRKAIGEDVVGLRVGDALRSILTVYRDTISFALLSDTDWSGASGCLPCLHDDKLKLKLHSGP